MSQCNTHNVVQHGLCAYAKNGSLCQYDVNFINYPTFVYCTGPANLYALPLTLCVCWLLFLFIALGISADAYFSPSLATIAKTLGISDNIAGVTFLAFGNGSPDVFSAIAAVATNSTPNTDLMFGALLGAGIFVTTVVVGSVALAKPFNLMQRPFLRDMVFFLWAVFIAFYVLYKKRITIVDAIMFLSLYVLYAIVVVVGRWIHLRIRAANKAEIVPPEQAFQEDSSNADTEPAPAIDDIDATSSEDEVDDDDLMTAVVPVSPFALYVHFYLKEIWRGLKPFSIHKLKSATVYMKVFIIIRAPLIVVFNLTVPLVDLDSKKVQNWNKPLTLIHCVICPIFFVVAIQYGGYKIAGIFPLLLLIFILTIPPTLLMWWFTSLKTAPRYLNLLAFAGFLQGVIWIYAIAAEIVCILEMLGIVLHISSTILGLTILAWANSLGDFFANVAVALKGYPRMGMSACFAGPMFNLLVGAGLSTVILLFRLGTDHVITLSFSHTEMILVAFVGASLIFSFIWLPIRGFRADRLYSGVLFGLYALFMLMILLATFNYI